MAWFILALGIAVAGACVRLVTSGYAALGTSGSNKIAAVAPELNTTGPYSLVRNPCIWAASSISPASPCCPAAGCTAP